MHSRPRRNKFGSFPGAATSVVSLPRSLEWHHTGRLTTSQTQLLFAHLCAFVLPTGRETKQKQCDLTPDSRFKKDFALWFYCPQHEATQRGLGISSC